MVGGDRAVQDGQLPIDRGTHGGPVPLPERGAALDVGEEEGDGAGGEIGHGPLQYARLDVVLPDCRTWARGDCAHTPQAVTVCLS